MTWRLCLTLSVCFGCVRIGHREESCSPVTQETHNPRHYGFLYVRVKAGWESRLHGAPSEPNVLMCFPDLGAPLEGARSPLFIHNVERSSSGNEGGGRTCSARSARSQASFLRLTGLQLGGKSSIQTFSFMGKTGGKSRLQQLRSPLPSSSDRAVETHREFLTSLL